MTSTSGTLNFTMPPGLTANLHGITYCPEADIAAAANTLGRVEQAESELPGVERNRQLQCCRRPGFAPLSRGGKIYMAGPFQGAPLSLVAITPALAGPYDYGTVVVRVALHIDPLDAHVIADSETVPEIIGGIPIRMREIQVNIDKPNFMINPTNCSPVQRRLAGDRRSGHGGQLFLSLPGGQLLLAAVLTADDDPQLGGRKSTARCKDPGLEFNLTTARVTPTSNRSP